MTTNSTMMGKLALSELDSWLRETNKEKLQHLYEKANEVRRETVGDQVHLRGLIEISNYCTENCTYCGIRNANTSVSRYRMDDEEILESARLSTKFGYGTVVIQAGEDPGIDAEGLAAIISEIKKATNLAVTLSMGERSVNDLELWRLAGADRYLLRFETSDLHLFNHIHCVNNDRHVRLELLKTIKAIGYETGSGVLVGVPGQTYETLTRDIDIFRQLDLDMIGIGPYVPHPKTPLARELGSQNVRPDTVSNDEEMVYKVLALTRLVRPDANIPSTSALATINATGGRQNGLTRGANIIMPNVTPLKYRRHYEIYPSKASSTQDPHKTNKSIMTMLQEIGRKPGSGAGSRTS